MNISNAQSIKMNGRGIAIYIVRCNGIKEFITTYYGPLEKVQEFVFEVHGYQCEKDPQFAINSCTLREI